VLWEYKPARKFNSFIVTPDTLLAAGQAANQAFLTAIDLQNGADIWQQTLPAAAVKGGTAVNHQQRIFAALEDGRLCCFGPAH
jgi:outer membrane protein assembly factor BamB